jgi:hypothetical protein
MDPTQPHGRQLKRRPGGQTNADLGLKRWMIHPSLKLGLIVYLRRLTGKQLVGAIAINGINGF